jgi:hypothetical protein
MVSSHTQAVDSVPIQANASMENVVMKARATSIDNHLKKVEEENGEPKKKNDPPFSAVYITAPEHHLRRLKKHQKNLLDNPVGALAASHEKAAAFKRVRRSRMWL